MNKPTIVFCVMSGPVGDDGNARRYYGAINSDVPNEIAPLNYRAEGAGHKARRIELSSSSQFCTDPVDGYTDYRDFEVVA